MQLYVTLIVLRKIIFCKFWNLLMIEKEIKILNIDYPSIVARFGELGIAHHETALIHDSYYDAPDHRLRREWLRAKIRSYGAHRHEITIKSKLSPTAEDQLKIRKETHLTIPSRGAWESLFLAMWLREQRSKEKIRFAYRYQDMHFDIDMYEGIPPLLEIEWPDQQTIMYRVKKLWLAQHKQTSRGTKKLFRRYSKTISSTKIV